MRPNQALGLLTIGVLFAACSDDGPAGPDTSNLEILILQGDAQFGEPGTLLPVPLEVRVQDLSDNRGEVGVKVRWEVVAGEGAELDQLTTLTDSLGAASVGLTLGPELGAYRVRASVKGMLSGPAEFEASAVYSPVLTLVPVDPVRAGDTIRLEGRNLSANPDEDVVTFSRIRGRVISASPTQLRVEVPPCLPTRGVELKVHIGALATDPATLQVLEGNQFLELAVGQDTILDAGQGFSCLRFPSEPGSQYLVVPQTTGTVGGGVYDVGFVGLTADDSQPLRQGPPGPTPGPEGLTGDSPIFGGDLQWAFDRRLRELEGLALKERGVSGVSPAAVAEAPPLAAPARLPQIGESREFNVLNPENDFEKVTATVRHITDHALIYMDVEAPSGGFAPLDLVRMAAEFETAIHPTVTEAFGAESDLDQNERVIILFTPAVNRLTPEGSEGYVGGFFFGIDLLADRTGSNEGEIFYAVVPDPTGIFGPLLARSTLLYSLPAILAHEFEHMVHFNQRTLLVGAEGQDALWLSEALAQMAEDLVGRHLQEMGDLENAQKFQLGNWRRARRFLLEPKAVSVLATLPPGTLAERGAGWLLLAYLFGHEEGGSLLREITASDLTGVANLTQAMGRPWAELVSDWFGAIYLDGLPIPVRNRLRVPGLNLRHSLSLIDGQFPLTPIQLGRFSFSRVISLWSSAADYYIITAPTLGGLAMNLSGLEGRPPNPASGLRLLVVRLE